MGAMTFAHATVTPAYGYEGNKAYVMGVLTGSASYATGGDSLDVEGELGLTNVDDLLVVSGVASLFSSSYRLLLTGTTNTPLIQAHTPAGEVANATNLSAQSWLVRFYGNL